jgi:threonine/homoserine/homoserine lactone efflux protein
LNISFVFLLGLLVAFIGVVPPGLLNLTAAKISLKEGYPRGFIFSLGACVIVGFQTYLAAIFAKYLNQHLEIVEILKRVALVVFVLVSIYFFFLAKRDANAKEIDALESKKSRFFQGIFMSALNMFPIPYQAYIITTLVTIKWIFLDNLSVVAYVAGTVSGTFVGFYIYILFFEKIKNSKISSQKYMSLAIASITALVAIITLVDVLLIS